MPNSTELMEKFQKDYGFNKSFDELVNEGDVFLTKFRAVKRFGQKEPNRSPEQKKYMNGLFYMLSIVIDKFRCDVNRKLFNSGDYGIIHTDYKADGV